MKPNIFKLFAVLIFLSLQLHSGFSQQDNIRFKRLTINDGLSLSSVYTVFQDAKGYMWFGTEDGLNKYDGKRFRIYRPIPGDSNSLSYKWTELIFEDSHGQLWFGSKGGLTRLNPENEHFTVYNSFLKRNNLTSDTVTCIFEDNKDHLWIGTDNGINQIDLVSNKVQTPHLVGNQINVIEQIEDELWVGTNHGLFVKTSGEASFKSAAINTKDSSNLEVKAIAVDSVANIWVGVGNKLYKSTKDEGVRTWSMAVEFGNGESSNQPIEKLVIDTQDNVWISCTTGLFKYFVNTGRTEWIIRSVDSSHSLAINGSKPLILDASGILWYGTFGDGIFRIETKTSRITSFRNNPGDLQSLSEDAINCIYQDRNDDIWFGTFGAGINIYRPESHKFGFLSHQPLNTNSLSSNFIWSILECKDQKLWIGTNDAGLNIYDPVSNQFQVYNHRPEDRSSLSHSSVREVYQDSRNRIWIGTDGGGLNRFFPETGRFIHYKSNPGDPSSISDNSVRVVYEDRAGRIWIGTRSGLNMFDVKSETFRRYTHNEAVGYSISNDFVYSAIYHDESGYLWVGTYGGGLNRMDIETGRFTHYLNDPSNPESLSDNIVFSIYDDPEGIFWIGTNSGLNRFDPKSGKFKRFGMLEGLPNEVIYGILADERNNLWLSTNKGICRFSLVDYSTKNFSASDGLQSNEFNGGAFCKGASGMMYFGGVYGLNTIDPELGYINENNSQVVITSLEILGNEVITKSELAHGSNENRVRKVEDEYYLPTHISYAEEIILDYQHRSFSIEYAALNNTNSDNLRFQYLVEGVDNDWNDAGTRNFISFANMPAGEYYLKVRSVNTDRFEGLSAANLRILVMPPFWKTWWFFLFEALLLIVLLTFVYKYLLKIRTNKLLRVQNEKIFQANQKLMDSERSLMHLNATKDKFFSIISHDLKNPFTSLLSLSELMAKDYKELDEEDKHQGISKVYESARRIFQLLENLLTWSRSQSGRLHFSPARLDLNILIKDNVNLLEASANSKGIKIRTQLPEEANSYCDEEMINTVIRNLINNAIKFSPIDSEVKVNLEELDAHWKLSVIDQGIGISETNRQKIFKIEKKFKTEGTAGEKGTGLGLIICKEFVEKNGGAISIESKVGEGSSFSFTIPKSNGFVE